MSSTINVYVRCCVKYTQNVFMGAKKQQKDEHNKWQLCVVNSSKRLVNFMFMHFHFRFCRI